MSHAAVLALSYCVSVAGGAAVGYALVQHDHPWLAALVFVLSLGPVRIKSTSP